MENSESYVFLDRRFRSVDASEGAEVVAEKSVSARWNRLWGEGIGWAEILKDAGVSVILGEPGSGRTEEFKMQHRRLVTDGEKAFYVPLHLLAIEKAEDFLDPKAKKDIEEWRSSERRGFFFLDAVDEAKLNSIAAWELAMVRFRELVGKKLEDHAHVLISCRVHQWEPERDPERVLSNLFPGPDVNDGTGNDSGPRKPKLFVYVILPLDETRIRTFAKERGGNDSDGFVRAVRRDDLWDFAGRPLDVEILLNYWNQKRVLGSLSEMIEFLVDHQLREIRKESRDKYPIPLEKLRDGAETLAVASMLCSRLDFARIPTSPSAGTALDPSKCLRGWEERDIETLFDRALFTISSRGRSRIYHREIADYLASCWIRKRHGEISELEIDSLFFYQHREKLVLRPSRESTAVWLACSRASGWTERFLTKLVLVSPDAFLRRGDPKALPSSVKMQIIDEFVERYRERELLRFETDDGVVARLADPDLAKNIARHLEADDVSPGVKIELLRIATIQKLKQCVPSALRLLKLESNWLDLSSHSALLISEAGSSSDREAVANLWPALGSIHHFLAGEIIKMLFPDLMDADALKILLRRASIPQGHHHYLADRLTRKIRDIDSTQTIVSLAESLYSLARDEDELLNSPVERKFVWLLAPLVEIYRALLGASDLDEQSAKTAGKLLWILQRSEFANRIIYLPDRAEYKCEAMEWAEKHPEVRRLAFWQDVAYSRRWMSQPPDPERKTLAMELASMDLKLEPVTADLRWALLDARDKEAERDRNCAFHLALYFWKRKGCPRWATRELQTIAVARDDWHRELREAIAAFRFYFLKGRIHALRCNRYVRTNWWRMQFSVLARQWRELRGHWRVVRGAKGIRDASNIAWLNDLCREAEDSMMKHIPDDLGLLHQKFHKTTGPFASRVVRATEAGCIRTWETYDPIISGNTLGGIPGAVGIQLLWRVGKIDFTQLSREEALRAARYSFAEINGFPKWFPSLLEAQPSAVRAIFEEKLAIEWDFENNPNISSTLFHDLEYHGESFRNLVFPFLKRKLFAEEPANFKVLDHAVSSMFSSGVATPGEWTDLASKRILIHPPESDAFTLWSAVWVQSDVQSAMKFISSLNGEFCCSNFEDNVVVALCAYLLGRNRRVPKLCHPDHLKPENIGTWTRFVHSWIRKERDTDRPHNEVFSPTDRDEAQTYRGNLFGEIGEFETDIGDELLESFMEDPDFADSKDYLVHLLHKRAERAADAAPWDVERFHRFVAERELQPSNCSELFDLVHRRLQSIRHDVEDAEESIRDRFLTRRNEAGLQSFLVREMRDRANDRYTVPKEPEIDGQQRVDFQVHASGIRGHVQVEVKLANMDGRTARTLREDLRQQLSERYLRDQESAFGFFLVGLAEGKERWRKIDGQGFIDFVGLIGILREDAKRIEKESSFSKRIQVVGIDFREGRNRLDVATR